MNKTEILSLPKSRVVKGIKLFHIWYPWVMTGFSVESLKNLWSGNFSNLKLNTKLQRKKTWNLDVNAFSEEGKRL